MGNLKALQARLRKVESRRPSKTLGIFLDRESYERARLNGNLSERVLLIDVNGDWLGKTVLNEDLENEYS